MADLESKIEQSSPLKRAIFALKQTQLRLNALESIRKEPIAIIGMGCRFPGAGNPDAFWRLLRDGVDAMTDIPPDRWDMEEFYDPDPGTPGKIYTRQAGFISGVDRFDPKFFGISPREATDMDPQQRLLLEVAWESLEDAGLLPEKLIDQPVGVYIGITEMEYAGLQLFGRPEFITPYTTTGSGLCFSAGRVSYVLGLQGPSVAMDTACSASLVAIHLACQSLRAGESQLALAGGVNLNLTPGVMASFSRVQALAPDGRCKTFDASADGYARGEGCGVIVLKRLSDARADGDNILALIRGSAFNHDGISSGLTVPNKLAQEKVIRQALENAGVAPGDVDYIEAHGTGTALGDPIEMGALGTVFAGEHTPDSPLTVGSVKTNFGHLEPAAGVAGLMKIVLSLQHEAIPAHLHFKTPNPDIDWENLPFRVPVERQPWPRGQGDDRKRRVAGVSSFSMSGANIHMVLEEAPTVGDESTGGRTPAHPGRALHLLMLSARDEAALRELAESYATWLDEHPEISLANACFTAATGRARFTHRLALVAASRAEAGERLRSGDYVMGMAGGRKPKTAFLFTGQGSQYPGMGRGLYEREPLFREILDRCDEILRPLDVPLLDLLYSENADPEALNQTIHTQPALFSLEVALARLWQSWGVGPDAVMGHSVGEYVAACIAGVFSLEDALKLIAARGRLMQTLCAPGDMLALQASESAALELIAPFAGSLSLAAINGPESVVVSGEPVAMEALQVTLVERGVKAKALSVSHAFHSGMMEPMLAEFEKVAGSLTYAEPKIPLCSNVTGKMAEAGEITGPAYWIRHVREPVRFAAGVETLHGKGIDAFLEVGPKPSLLGMAQGSLPDGADEGAMGWLPSLREGQDDELLLLRSLGQWFARGGEVDWESFEGGGHGEIRRRKVPLPTYPFQRQRYWLEKARLVRGAEPDRSGHPLLGQRLDWADSDDKIRFQARLDPSFSPWLADCRVLDSIVLPVSGYLEMALAAGAEVFGPDAGEERPASLGITNVTIERPLILPEEETATIQLVLSPGERGYSFQVFSSGAKGQWRAHVAGDLVMGAEPEPLEALDLAVLREQCATEVSVDGHYRGLRERSLDYGPGFQGMKQLFRGEGVALGEIALPESLTRDSEKYRWHPALLDAAFQVSAVLSDASGETYLPVSLGSFRSYRPAGERPHNRLWSFAKVTGADEKTLIADISLFDESGVPVARIEGFTAGRMAPETLRRHFRKQLDELYQVAWREVPAPKAAEPPAEQAPGSWLILADGAGFGEELATRLEAQGNRCVLAYADTVGWGERSEPQQSGSDAGTDDRTGSEADAGVCGSGLISTYTLDSADPAAFQALFQDAFPPDAPPLSGIVYLWALDAPSGPELTTEALVKSQRLVCGGALHLTQAMAERESRAKLWLVTRHAVAVGGESEARAPVPPLSIAQATLWGMGKSIALEYPELWGGLIDNPTPDALLREIEAGEIAGGRGAPSRENQIAYRGGARHAPRLVRGESPPDTQLPLRPDASYLITGGLGGLGLMLARWMAEGGARNLVLIGRREPSEEAKGVLRELEQIGARVMVASADVADEGRMTALFREIAEQMPPLKGIVHTAGVLDDGVLREQALARFEQVLSPKVTGGWLLDTLSRDLPLDFFVCFSSMTAVLGSTGQANYAAANAFLDALAHHRHALGLPGLSIDWGTWGGVGMAANLEERDRNRLAAIGLELVEPAWGVSMLGRLMGHSERIQVGVSPTDWSLFLGQFPVAPPFLSELGQSSGTVDFREALQKRPPDERREYLMAYVQSELNRVLGFDPAQPMDPGGGFTDMGMDSLMIVESRNRLQVGLGCALPSTVLFKYPTLDKLIEYVTGEVLASEFSEASRPNAEPEDAGSAADESEAALDKVKQLSEEELEKLIAGKFQAVD